MTQSHLTSALAGAVIAAALVPPFTTSGPQVVFLNWIEVSNEKHVLEPPLLVSINVLTIMLSAAFALWASVMKPDSRTKGVAGFGIYLACVVRFRCLLVWVWMLPPKVVR